MFYGNRFAIQRSLHGSVQLMNGVFYTYEWKSSFVPLDEQETQAFLKRINDLENQVGRRLTAAEIRQVELAVS
jgi:uncharacterized protein involved in tolerance to divalent cations